MRQLKIVKQVTNRDAKSLEKSFKILEILSKSIFPLKAANISRKAVISRTTTFRLLSVLCQLGYIHKANYSLHY